MELQVKSGPKEDFWILVVVFFGALAVMTWARDASSALPPKCTGTRLDTSTVVQHLRDWDEFKPLLRFGIATSSIDTCDGSAEFERLELVFNVPIANHMNQIPLMLWIDAKDGAPEGSQYNKTAIRNIVESVSGLTQAIEKEQGIGSWLANYPTAVGYIQPRTAVQPLCVRYVSKSARRDQVDRLWWCSDRGILDYTIRRWDEVTAVEGNGLARYVAQLRPNAILHQAKFDRHGGTWRADILFHDGNNSGPKRMSFTLKDSGWAVLE